MTKQSITQLIILVSTIIWVAWDLYAYLYIGNPATISATVWRYAYYCPGIAFFFGLVCGHFFFQMHEPTEFPTKDSK